MAPVLLAPGGRAPQPLLLCFSCRLWSGQEDGWGVRDCGCCLSMHPLHAWALLAALQVPFAPFEGGPIVEDAHPVLEFSGK